VGRGAMVRMRGKLMQAGKAGKMLMGAVMVALAAMILSGADKPLETWLIDHSPEWLTRLTTRF
jgi:cytochrome c-type biogenesis protein